MEVFSTKRERGRDPQKSQLPQLPLSHFMPTWSPVLISLTRSPTATTTPAPVLKLAFQQMSVAEGIVTYLRDRRSAASSFLKASRLSTPTHDTSQQLIRPPRLHGRAKTHMQIRMADCAIRERLSQKHAKELQQHQTENSPPVYLMCTSTSSGPGFAMGTSRYSIGPLDRSKTCARCIPDSIARY